MVQVWSVIIHDEDDPIGHAVSYEGEQDFADEHMARFVFDQARRNHYLHEAPVIHNSGPGWVMKVIGPVGDDGRMTHIELQRTDWG